TSRSSSRTSRRPDRSASTRRVPWPRRYPAGCPRSAPGRTPERGRGSASAPPVEALPDRVGRALLPQEVLADDPTRIERRGLPRVLTPHVLPVCHSHVLELCRRYPRLARADHVRGKVRLDPLQDRVRQVTRRDEERVDPQRRLEDVLHDLRV